MICQKTWAAAALAAALAAAPAAWADNQVGNGGFESGGFSGWTAMVGPFSGVDALAAHSGSFGAFLGEFGSAGTLSQSLATVAGTPYTVSFWLRNDGATPSEFSVSWGGTQLFASTDLGPFAYTEFTLSAVAADALTTLQFGFRSDNGFIEIDDIAVTVVPEPGAFALMGVGLLGLAWARRRSTAAR